MNTEYSLKIRFLLILIIFSGVFVTNDIMGQIAIGEWRDHLSFRHANCVTEAGNRIYCAANTGLFYYDKQDFSIQKLSKVTGLSDINISRIKYSPDHDLLLIAYSNGNIDLLKDNTIYNLSDIKRKPLIGSKTINDILFLNDEVYLSCGFGIVVLNINKKEVKDTYFIGENGGLIQVYGMASDNIYLYAATESGIYKAEADNPNLVNYEFWSRITDISNYDKKFNAISCFDNKIVANFSNENTSADTIYVYDGVIWSYFDPSRQLKNYSIVNNYNNIIISSNSEINIYNSSGENIRNVGAYGFDVARSRYAILDQDNTLWIADIENGLIKNEYKKAFESIYPNGPYDHNVAAMTVVNKKLYTVGGGKDAAWNNIWNLGKMSFFIDESWTEYVDDTIRDFVKIVIDPTNSEHVYAGSWGYGLHEFMNGELIYKYDYSNSILETSIPGSNYCRIGGLAFDQANNLWITNSGVSDPVVVIKADNSWKSFAYGGIIDASTIGDIIVTKNNHKWVILPRGEGLFAFDNGETIDETNDDRTRKFGIIDENGESVSNNIFSITEDLRGNIWIGTDKGVVVYYNPGNVFTGSNFYAQRVKIPGEIEGEANYLLATETVTAIAVDGADRKWFGTANAGVFLMSKDATREILNYNSSNSPLLSDNITSIAIDNFSGEVYFGTYQGIISYRSTASEGKETFQQVYVFPNPVREDYNGIITITGLVSNTNVKITDISGNIVYETTSHGGQAIWDGKNFSGDKVHTGVYLVFITNDDGSKTYVTKILFIN